MHFIIIFRFFAFFVIFHLRGSVVRPKTPLTGGAEALVGTPGGASETVERREQRQSLVINQGLSWQVALQ
ncbi:hypothetical protein, partial [Aliiroseovarius marinus]|uniref:hypothetical protein n=1 Tax=Aliiroseovarius marinus TaxID=2500159 RepID=UPI003D7DA8D4